MPCSIHKVTHSPFYIYVFFVHNNIKFASVLVRLKFKPNCCESSMDRYMKLWRQSLKGILFFLKKMKKQSCLLGRKAISSVWADDAGYRYRRGGTDSTPRGETAYSVLHGFMSIHSYQYIIYYSPATFIGSIFPLCF